MTFGKTVLKMGVGEAREPAGGRVCGKRGTFSGRGQNGAQYEALCPTRLMYGLGSRQTKRGELRGGYALAAWPIKPLASGLLR